MRGTNILFFLIFFIRTVEAQDSPNKLYTLSLEELSKIQISSSKRITSESLDQACASVSVITSEQISNRGYLSLIDLLEDLPNVKVDRAVDPRWFNDVTVRGVRYSDKFIVLLDGVRISSPTNEIIPIMENYPLFHLKQVEILYGPVSSLYGADAFVGVINMVTKEVDKNGNISGNMYGGQYGLFTGNLLMTNKFESGIEVTVGGQYHADRQPDLADFYPELYSERNTSLSTGVFNTTTGLGTVTPSTPVDPEAGFPIDASALYARIAYRDFSLIHFRNHARLPSSTANDPRNSVYNEDQLFGHSISTTTARYFKQSDKWSSNSQLTFSTYRLDPLSNFRNVFTLLEPAYLFAESWKLKGEQLFEFSLSDQTSLSGSITGETFYAVPRTNNLEEPVKNGNLSTAVVAGSAAPNNPDGIAAELQTSRYNVFGGFLEFNFSPNEKLNFILGSRLDKDERYELTINPRVGAVYADKKVIFKTLFGTAFLAPSPQNIFDRYGSFMTEDNGMTYSSTFFQLPNPELAPQTISTIETDLKYFIRSNLTFNLSSYYSRTENLISPVTNEISSSQIAQLYPASIYHIDGIAIPIDRIQINDNLGKSTIYGGSIGLNYQFQPSNFNGSAFASLSFVDGTIDIDEDGAIVERNLPGVAPLIVKFGGTLQTKKMTFHLRGQIVGTQRTFSTNSIEDVNQNDNIFDDEEYKEIEGYYVLNGNFIYSVNGSLKLSLGVRNLFDRRFKNVNIGAGVNESMAFGSEIAEFKEGAPQNPIRIITGLSFQF